MGSAGSKAAGRTYQAAAQQASKAVSSTEQLSGAVAKDAARAAQVSRPQLTFEQEEELESKDQALGSFLDQLGSAIQGKAVNITPSREQLRQQHVPQVQDSSGRLPPDALRELLQLQAQTEGAPLQAAQRLLQKHGVDPAAVQRALSHCCLPDIIEASGPGGVKAFGEWPAWFQRRS